jgi:hypothetical protein
MDPDGPKTYGSASESPNTAKKTLDRYLVSVEDSDVPGGGGGRHVEGGLLHAGAAVQGAGKGSHGAGDDDELVDLLVGEPGVRPPQQLLQLLQLLLFRIVFIFLPLCFLWHNGGLELGTNPKKMEVLGVKKRYRWYQLVERNWVPYEFKQTQML